MITIKNITMKNFMSVGNVTQSINFEDKSLVLVLGENLDLGGHDSRNGVGKSTIINALSYAFFGGALTNIRRDNLVNKTNGKQMMVTLEFEKDGVEYTIERGRKPNKFAVLVAGTDINDDDTDEAQGDSRVTQQYLERELGLSHTMFKNIVALNTYSEPFLSMKAADQRDIIEQLLGITKLSEKAEVLKELLRGTKEQIRDEEVRIETVKGSNERIESNIKSLELKSKAWETNQANLIAETKEAIAVLEDIDIDEEITNHKALAGIKETRAKHKSLESEKGRLDRTIQRLHTDLGREQDSLAHVNDKTCHTCGQHLLDEEKAEEIKNEIVKRVEEKEKELGDCTSKRDGIVKQLEEIVLEDEPVVFYDELEDAYNHRSSLDSLRTTLEVEEARENHFIEQIKTLQETGLQKIEYGRMNDLTELRDHQDFLLKLLTSKDSFIRRKIIDQNLAYLNARLEHYLDRIGLPHKVKFQSDLNVEITEHGRDLDFDNLSRGERTRLILSLSWAFRDVYESLNNPISLLFIDELIDSGLDTAGVESSIAVLKQMVREANRNVFLISHRDELVGRVGSVLKVIKEGGFTSFEDGNDEVL
jgi:DNA repair exonuclease SbcCD ATPase subunit